MSALAISCDATGPTPRELGQGRGHNGPELGNDVARPPEASRNSEQIKSTIVDLRDYDAKVFDQSAEDTVKF